ncbi:MAG: aminopeptidase P family protein [Erysipelotrichaceae bacterium]|nr:aminopeptidase P family protein [Erysipelotrichaceae bacterium]
MVKEHLNRLKNAMEKEGIDVYYLNTSDYHMSEYVPEHFRTILYFSGFTGSMATLLVTKEDAYIFVDGRYHLQADRQCLPNGVKVMKLGTADTDDPIGFLKKNFKGKVIGLDGRRTGVNFAKDLVKQGLNILSKDIYSDLIEDRAPLSKDPLWKLDERFTGLSRKKKIELIRYCLSDKVHIVNNLESIAYLLNLRGNDIPHTPVFLSYLVILDGEVYLFCDLERFSEELLDELYDDGIIIRPYESYYDFLKLIRGKKILIDENKVNYETYLSIKGRGNKIYDMTSIIEEMKAVKNPVEQENMRLAHIYDGVAVLRFLMWLDSVDKNSISEYDAKEKIDSLRLEYKAIDLSFSSIVAYNENAAQMHYAPTKEDHAMLKDKGILLFDTGGHYLEGSTDITRTVALGEVDEEVRMWFTLVLKSMFNLSSVKFLKGMNGNQLDILARKDLWARGIDYRCGTGHGVGYLLAVHESPPNVRHGHTKAASELAQFKPGMICSDEPGVYFDGKFGIRCENMILCKKDELNEYGQFLSFETLTKVPFDRKLIDKRYLDQETAERINAYHEDVYQSLLPYLNEEEEKFLRKLTEKI